MTTEQLLANAISEFERLAPQLAELQTLTTQIRALDRALHATYARIHELECRVDELTGIERPPAEGPTYDEWKRAYYDRTGNHWTSTADPQL